MDIKHANLHRLLPGFQGPSISSPILIYCSNNNNKNVLIWVNNIKNKGKRHILAYIYWPIFVWPLHVKPRT